MSEIDYIMLREYTPGPAITTREWLPLAIEREAPGGH